MEKILNYITDTIRKSMGFIILLIAIIIIRIVAFTPLVVDGISMSPTLKDNDYIILNKLDNSFERFEVVVIHEDFSGEGLIKRVIGLPGETIRCKNNVVSINGEPLSEDFLNEGTFTEDFGPLVIADGFYYVLGDNREHSSDSRRYGVIEKKYIEGSVNLRVYPFNKMGTLD